MLFPELARFTDVALLLLRVMVGVVFVTSGWNHLREPEARSKDIEQSKGVTIFLGAAELAAGLGVMLGVLTQLAAIGLILIMLAAIWKRFSSGVPASGANREQMAGATTPCLSS
jgi:putative oxidoreductase